MNNAREAHEYLYEAHEYLAPPLTWIEWILNAQQRVSVSNLDRVLILVEVLAPFPDTDAGLREVKGVAVQLQEPDEHVGVASDTILSV